MPPFMLLISLTLGLLLHEGSCVALVRSEKDEVHLELKASGELHHSQHKDLEVDAFGMAAWHEEQRKMKEVLKASGKNCEGDMCDFDYPVGTGQEQYAKTDGSIVPTDGENGCDCADTTNHQLILQEEMCIQAAREAGVTAPTGVFLIPADKGHDRPKGCFKLPCKEDVRGICYFFNGIGDTPYGCLKDPATGELGKAMLDGRKPTIKGVAVCSRPKFLNGTIDGNDGCPNGYGVVMDEDLCREAGTCLGDCEGDEFRKGILNQTQHNDYPEGCFFDHTKSLATAVVADAGNSTAAGNGTELIQKSAPVTLSAAVPCVYFNAPIAGVAKSAVLVGGTPICNVSTITDFRSLPHIPLEQRLASGHAAGNATPAAPTPTTQLLEQAASTASGDAGEGNAGENDAGSAGASQSGSSGE